MNINDYKDTNGNVEVSETLVSDLIGNLNTHKAEYANQLSNNGYQKLPGGLIIQWGFESFSGVQEASSNGVAYKTKVTNFPITFPNAIFSVTTSTYRSASAGHNNATKSSVSLTLSKLSNVWEDNPVYYIAIGY